MTATGAKRLRGMFTSMSCEWATPEAFFKALDSEFVPFDLDACASKDNARVAVFNDSADIVSALAKPWKGRVWCNPPYGRTLGQWIKKAYTSAQEGATVVCLLPARTDTRWWHDYCMKGEIRFVKGRIHFNGKGPAPFPSAVVIFNGGRL